jgi:hypothetical protein
MQLKELSYGTLEKKWFKLIGKKNPVVGEIEIGSMWIW